MGNEIKLLSIKSVAEKLDCGITYIEDAVRDGTFPKPAVKRGRKFVRWLASDVDAWIMSPPSESGEAHQ